MTQAGFFGPTVRYDVTDVANSFTVDGPPEARRSFIVTANVDMHLSRDGDADTDTAMRVPANAPVSISAFGGDVISFVKGAGMDDGSLWVTQTDR